MSGSRSGEGGGLGGGSMSGSRSGEGAAFGAAAALGVEELDVELVLGLVWCVVAVAAAAALATTFTFVLAFCSVRALFVLALTLFEEIPHPSAPHARARCCSRGCHRRRWS